MQTDYTLYQEWLKRKQEMKTYQKFFRFLFMYFENERNPPISEVDMNQIE